MPEPWFQLDGFTDVIRGIPPVDVRFGAGRAAELGSYLEARGLGRAMLVAGRHVSADEKVMGPIREAIGPRVVGEFFEVTPGKRIEMVYAGIERMREVGADVLIGIGGGSSLDVARQVSTLAADGRSLDQLREQARSTDPPAFEAVPHHTAVVLVPTTLAGADLSTGGSVEVFDVAESPDDQPRWVNPQVVGPTAILYDPRLYESTPPRLLAGSAMNGFDKGIETIYSPRATAFSDAMAERGVALMGRGLLALATERSSGLEDAVAGAILVQVQRQISVVHAFGRAATRLTSMQQGIAHAVLVPHALRLLLSLAPLRREVLARALRTAGATATPDDGEAVVEGVSAIRDALGLPRSLADVPEADGIDVAACAAHVCGDRLLDASPLPRRLTPAEAASVFEAAA